MKRSVVRKLVKGTSLWCVGGVSPRVKMHALLIGHFRDSGHELAARFFEARLQRRYGVFLSHRAEFPRSLDLKHPIGIVVGEGVKLGERVVIFQNVTLGGARMGDLQASNYPEIGDDTVIFAGAVVVGKIKIGKQCIIGANSVVTRDVPDYATAAGVPARIVRLRAPSAESPESTS